MIVTKHLVKKIIKLGEKNMIIMGDYETNFGYKISTPILSFTISVLSPSIFIGRNTLIIVHYSIISVAYNRGRCDL